MADDPRQRFILALAKHPEDDTTRVVYADWLEEHGEDDEADRQRRFPASRKWLEKFCADNNPQDEEEREYIATITPEDLLRRATEAVDEYREMEAEARAAAGELATEAEALATPQDWSPAGPHVSIGCGSNENMSYALWDVKDTFWNHWAVLTGEPLPPGLTEACDFRCAC